MIVGSVVTLIISRLFGTAWTSVEIGIFATDIIALFALVYLALKSDRFWPLWATAFHLLAVTVHTAMMVAPQISSWAFATGAVFWAYPMLLALAIGSSENTPVLSDCEIDPV